MYRIAYSNYQPQNYYNWNYKLQYYRINVLEDSDI